MKPLYPPVGFHGDTYLMKLVDFLSNKIKFFVETGTNAGATLRYFAKKYPNVKCFSCEPGRMQFNKAIGYTKNLKNVKIYNLDSKRFLGELEKNHNYIFQNNSLYWLDAHGRGFEWPLLFEIEFITRKVPQSFILIDDFQVPGKKEFQFDRYHGQSCSYPYIQGSINAQSKYSLYYPNYTEHTSKYHPLVGWGLLELYGECSVNINGVFSFVKKA